MITRLTLLIALLVTLPSCAGSMVRPPAQPPQPAPRAFLLHLPGIVGPGPADESFVRGLRQAGLELEIEIYDWTDGRPALRALADVEGNRAIAERIAGRIAEMSRLEPNLHIHLAGHSGGGGIAVWVLEALPQGLSVESLLLLAPALSPQYDLSPALGRVRGRAYHFYTPYDLLLGPGTRAFGTIDRARSDAAGRVGFEMPRDADPKQYRKLVPMPYDPQWSALDNDGGHVGMLRWPFVREVIAPLLRRHGPRTGR